MIMEMEQNIDKERTETGELRGWTKKGEEQHKQDVHLFVIVLYLTYYSLDRLSGVRWGVWLFVFSIIYYTM